MKRTILLLLAVFVAMSMSACNYQVMDLQYSFSKAIVKMPDDTVKEIDIKCWTDYEDGEQLQITDKDGTVYLVSSFNCVLIDE